jgi:hypothetical protein
MLTRLEQIKLVAARPEEFPIGGVADDGGSICPRDETRNRVQAALLVCVDASSGIPPNRVCKKVLQAVVALPKKVQGVLARRLFRLSITCGYTSELGEELPFGRIKIVAVLAVVVACDLLLALVSIGFRSGVVPFRVVEMPSVLATVTAVPGRP